MINRKLIYTFIRKVAVIRSGKVIGNNVNIVTKTICI